jgi:ribonuclease HIII
MGNKSYNEIYEKINNLNHMLAWGHARVLENVLNQVDCQVALSDQFGNPALVQNNLMAKGRQITLFQRHGAESNLAVAAASILAREAFVSTLEKMEAAFEMNFPKGCSVETQKAAKAFVTRYGMESLNVVAKLHFKLTAALQQS